MIISFIKFKNIIPFAGLFCALLLMTTDGQANFELIKGDRISIVGNSLGERMQHDGWLETLLQSEFPEHQLVIRNLSFPGDRVSSRPRSEGSPSLEDYLNLCRSDVIFMMFGYNESFAGKEGIEVFESDLGDLVEAFQRQQPNGNSMPRIVLFSPIAREDLGLFSESDSKRLNEQLSLYRDSIRKVSLSKDCYFIDLFEPTLRFYEEEETSLTINEVHLNSLGNHRVAEYIVSELTGGQVTISPDMEPIRESVLDKNLHWFNRYRATDGNNVWGERSLIEYVDGQTNADVLSRELIMFDVLTQNRDRQIWTRAKGGDIAVDDSNVPRSVEVPTNIGFWEKSHNEDSEGSLKYLSGKAGIEEMTVPDGFTVNLFADESMFPELVNPVQLSVDTSGRLWAAVWNNYPRWDPHTEMDDALLIFPDDNNDGVADRAITFAKVPNPTAFEFWNGGVLVASQPDIWFLKDTDGDDIADEKVVYLNGLGSADSHHAASNLIYGPDGGIYWQSGVFLVNNIEHPYGASFQVEKAGLFRFDPRQFTIQFLPHDGLNPHGNSFDHWGYQYSTDATSGECYQVMLEEGALKMHWMLNKTVRPVSANEIISSANFPRDYQQDFLICNTIGFLGIKRYDLARSGTTASYTEGRFWSKKTESWEVEHGEIWGREVGDLLLSEDGNFRPSDIEFGSDGALYIADWHNVIVGHMQHNVRDPSRDKQHGRIYRMVYDEKPLQEPVTIAGASLDQLMRNLEHPIDGVRYRTRIELSNRDEDEVLTACKKWMEEFDPHSFKDAHHLLEALWLHQRLDVKDHELLSLLLSSPDLHVRNAAQRVQLFWHQLNQTGYLSSEENSEATEVLPSGIVSETDSLIRVNIGTVPDKMSYALAEFRVPSGKQVELTFFNPDFMPHNIVFVLPGEADAVAAKAIQLGADGFIQAFVPDDDRIIAASGLVDYGKEELLTFKAPSIPGRYEFVCTFPGHHLMMRGVMIVE